ncbi:MAG: hypothetical protein ABR536_01905 [Solirubrobacterales bacterium]
MEMRGFRRSLLGYDRREVDAALAEREARQRRLESEAKRMGAKLDDRERRLKKALEELAVARESVAGNREERDSPIELEPEVGMGRLLEEMYVEAVRQAARLGDRALDRSVRASARIRALGRLGELLGGDEGGSAAPAIPEPAAARSRAAARPAALPEEMFDGEIEVEIGPLRDFAQLSGFEDTANSIGATGEIQVKRFSGGRATLAVGLAQPVELLRELEQRSPLEFQVRSQKKDRLVLDVDQSDEPAAT